LLKVMSKNKIMYHRSIFGEFQKRMEEERRFIQVILGPRQVGKTTLILQLLEKIETPSLYLSADNVEGSGEAWIKKHWHTARVRLKSDAEKEFILVIDEIQKIADWSSVVKHLWDEDTVERIPLKVILSGSSRLLVQQGLTESLAGRYEVTYMNHWSFSEMHQAFGWDAERYAWFGGYPGSASLITDEQRWKRYISDALIETSISRDILMLTRVDKPALMRRLFELGCRYSGQELSFTKILGQLQDAGNTVTLSHYLRLLSSAGLLTGLEKYSGSAVRQRSSSPKFIVHNTALLSSLSASTFEEATKQPEKWGRVVESAIGSHLIDGSVRGLFDLYYWRNGSNEVDFVVVRNHRVTAIEVKSGSMGSRSGMELFSSLFKPHSLLLVGEKGIPWQEFLRTDLREIF